MYKPIRLDCDSLGVLPLENSVNISEGMGCNSPCIEQFEGLIPNLVVGHINIHLYTLFSEPLKVWVPSRYFLWA